MGTGGMGGEGGAGGAGGGGMAGPTLFDLYLKIDPAIKSKCYVCHKENGSAPYPFFAGKTPEERYQSVTGWEGLITESPAQSPLVVHPEEPSHADGNAERFVDNEKVALIEWLTAEAKVLPEGGGDIGPAVKPFKPLGGGAFNTVYLASLGPDFEFASISFNAKAIGGTADNPTMLWLSNITVHTIADKPIHIVHPLFTVYAPSSPADPDPADSFSNIDQTFTIEGDPTLGTGEVVLTNWKKNAYLGLAFEIIEIYGGNAGGGGCTDVAKFKAEVVPQMQTCMSKCHGGTDPQAKGTMNLSELNAATPTAACVEVRARIKPGKPAESQILIVTDPVQVVVHKYKFDGNLIQYNAFRDAVSPWISAEQ